MTNETAPHDNGAADPGGLMMTALTSAPDPDSDAITDPAIAVPPAEPAPPSFDDLGLHPDVKLALDDMGYFSPTPVQTAVFKPVNEGKDLLVQSRTGTGKTTAFGLPLISRLVPTHRTPQALILAPTRELALQVSRELTQLGKHRGILVEPIYGGAPIGKQINALRDGVHIIVGTPGRVLDHIGRRTLDCKTITTFVLDECDEMLSMGFLEDIERIVSHLPEKKQTLLFSATMPDEVTRYARRHMVAPEQIMLSRDSISVAEIHHAYYIVSGIARSRDLLKIIFSEEPESAIIFCNTRDETTMVAKFLQKQGLDAEPLSSDLSQADRERVMGRMKKHDLRFLCATDVAARGIDITDLSHVINYSVPESPEIYVHRTGRTGRAGKKGTALSMVGPRELGNFRYVRLQFGIKPEERVIPKDDIFEGKLKVPLPPIGTPQPPDPVQLLIRGVTGTASELERTIFEKLLGTVNGKRVLAKLVAERLDQLSTRSRPKPRPSRDRDRDHDEGRTHDHAANAAPGASMPGERDGEAMRPREEGRTSEGDRPRFDGDRPRRDRDRGDRFGGGGGGGDRDDRPRRFGGDRDRDRGGRFGERGERDRGERGGERDRSASGGERGGERGERDRGGRFDRDRDRNRDRGERREPRHENDVAPQDSTLEQASLPVAAMTAMTAMTETAPAPEPRAADEHREHREHEVREDRAPRSERSERSEHHEHHERQPRDRDRVRRDTTVDSAPAAEVDAPGEPPAKVDDVARAALERADRGDRKRGRGKAEPTTETREFWETWADAKTARVDEPVVEIEPTGSTVAESPTVEARPSRRDGERGGRGERSGGGREKREGRGRDRDRRPTLDDKPARAPREAAEPALRGKKEAPATTADAGAQARLFISLGKKHGVSADDLRNLLAGPIGGDTAKIGSVSLRDSHAHVRVPEDLVEAIIAGVHGTTHAEHSVTVERSRA